MIAVAILRIIFECLKIMTRGQTFLAEMSDTARSLASEQLWCNISLEVASLRKKLFISDGVFIRGVRGSGKKNVVLRSVMHFLNLAHQRYSTSKQLPQLFHLLLTSAKLMNGCQEDMRLAATSNSTRAGLS